MTLATEPCVPCRADAPPITGPERESLCRQVPAWRLSERNGVAALERAFTFKDFAQALAYTNRVGALAEAADHHPEIVTEWGRVTVAWWTHAIGGLHRNDFIMQRAATPRFRARNDASAQACLSQGVGHRRLGVP